MSTQLFQDELSYLRDVGRELVQQNPKLAPYLGRQSADPDVERLLQGFAFLTARLRGHIDDEMSDFTHALIALVCPNFLRPFPSVTMIKFTPLDRSITERQIIAAGGELLSSKQAKTSNIFTTRNAVTLYPLEIQQIELERAHDSSLLRVKFHTISHQPLKNIDLQDLRLTLTGDDVDKQTLYLWLGRYLKTISIVSSTGTRHRLDPERHLTPIGFSESEALLPQQASDMQGWRLLQEYFAFPDKFYGYDLTKLNKFFVDDIAEDFTLEFNFSRPLPIGININQTTISLYCVPAVNLFPYSAVRFSPREDQLFYPVQPAGEQTKSIEIFSIDEVYSSSGKEEQKKQNQKHDKSITYPAYETFCHQSDDQRDKRQIYWRVQRRRSFHSRNFDHHLFFVHHNHEPALPPVSALAANLTCFNPHCARELSVGDICISTDAMPSFVSYRNINKPSEVIYPPLDGEINWQLVSNFAPNFTSLLNCNSVGAILSVYNYAALYDRQMDRAAKQRIDAITSFQTKPVDRLFGGLPIRGLKSTMKVRGEAFATEGELYLFSHLLADFFSLYATINSFHELEVQEEASGTIYQWPPKEGRQPLI